MVFVHKRLILFTFFLVSVAAAVYWAQIHFRSNATGATAKADRPSAGPAQPGQVAAPEAILDFVRDLKQPLVLVNFWASWCEPCKKEMPALKKLEAKYRDQGLRVILVSIDDLEEIDVAADYLRDTEIEFPAFYKGEQSLKFVSRIFPDWTGAVPASVLLGRDLKILDSWEGDSSFEEFDQRVNQQIKGS